MGRKTTTPGNGPKAPVTLTPAAGLAAAEPLRTLGWMRQAHQQQLALCGELEAIADSLPANIDRQQCLLAAARLEPLIRNVHHYEENTLFPWLRRRNAADDDLARTLHRLTSEHCEDACFAEELTEALLILGSGGGANMDAVGYMLRGFFEGLRRHIAFEREHLLGAYSDDEIVMPYPL